MKHWTTNATRLFFSRRGETLVESVLSILIFSLLMLAITTMIATSLNMIRIASDHAAATQQLVNQLVEESYPSSRTLHVTFSDANGVLYATQEVRLTDEEELLAFIPEVTP